MDYENYYYFDEMPPESQNHQSPQSSENPQEPKKKDFFGKLKKNFNKKVACILVVALLAGGIGGAGFAAANHFVAGVLGDNDITLSQTTPVSTSSGSGSGDVVAVVENCMPSVVSITNKGVTEVRTFFGSFQQESKSSGSGVIIGKDDDELLIVTNYHVVEGSRELTVVFSFDENQSDVTESRCVEAVIKGYDSTKDLAVIGVSLSDLDKDTLSKIKVAAMGSSDDLVLGEEVIAIGNALGYGQSVTNGIISALGREMTISDGTNTFSGTYLQTNAAINPGNSGGALLNMKGELIGINSAKVTSSSVDAVGYAIPISDAEPIIQSILDKAQRSEVPESQRGYLGITGGTVTETAMSQYGMPAGVYVSDVTAGTGAAAAGLSKGCVITAIDGTSVTSMEDLQNILKYYKAGEKVSVETAIACMNGYTTESVEVKLSNAKAAGIK